MRWDPKGDVFVVAGPPTTEQAPNERFEWAFRRSAGRRFVFTSWIAGACLLALALAIGTLGVGLSTAHLRIRRANALARSVRLAYSTITSGPSSYRRSACTDEPASVEECLARGARSAKRALLHALVTAALLLSVAMMGAVWWAALGFYRFVL
jgi:hypothetical protein